MQTDPDSPDTTPESLVTTLRSFPAAVWVLFVGVFLNKFGTFVVPFLTLYLTRQGFTTADAGLAVGAYGLGRIGAAIFGGQLADKMGRRKTIVLSMVTAAVTMLLLSQAKSLWLIVVLTGAASLTGELYVPACVALLADLVPERQRVTAFAAYRMAFNAGWAFGPATAALLASHSFLWLFVGDALSSILFGIVAWFWLPRGTHSSHAEAGWGEAFRVLRYDRRMHQVAIATVCIGFVIHQMVSSYGLHVTSLGYSDAVYGSLLSWNGVLVVICGVPLTIWSRRYAARPIIALGYVTMSVGVLWNLKFNSVSGLFVGMTLFTLGEMLFAPVCTAYVSSLAPARMRGRYIGAWALANSASLMFAPAAGMWVFARNPAVLWIGCGLLAVCAALAIAWNGRERTLPGVIPAK